ncbi:MAG: NADH-quinone oxidoreductase subunit C [Chloroflexota bacterium]|nr:NADH-quinone oxidoreductase subunit C [Dehalococcoidia bacterium]MDW8252319.1 NADH-quinone oxidoreductase subunit C [Chloroflexota bacterium]
MTTILPPTEVAALIRARFPDAVQAVDAFGVRLAPASLVEVCQYLRDEPSLAFDYLVMETAVDYIEDDYFEVVYVLRSLQHNHELALKVRTDTRDDPVVPSLVDLWQTAEFQEREIYDLFGIRFAGHPDLRRLFLWEEFRGHPLRKDFLPLAQ